MSEINRFPPSDLTRIIYTSARSVFTLLCSQNFEDTNINTDIIACCIAWVFYIAASLTFRILACLLNSRIQEGKEGKNSDRLFSRSNKTASLDYDLTHCRL